MSSTTIAVIGSGIIGRTLATRFAQAGHTVTFGARTRGNADLAAFAQQIGARVTDIGTAIDATDVVLFAINGAAMSEAVPAFGARLGGRIVVDATNHVGGPSLNSLATLAEHVPPPGCPGLNSLGPGAELRRCPSTGGRPGERSMTRPPVFGPEGESRAVVAELIGATGLRHRPSGFAASTPTTRRSSWTTSSRSGLTPSPSNRGWQAATWAPVTRSSSTAGPLPRSPRTSRSPLQDYGAGAPRKTACPVGGGDGTMSHGLGTQDGHRRLAGAARHPAGGAARRPGRLRVHLRARGPARRGALARLDLPRRHLPGLPPRPQRARPGRADRRLPGGPDTVELVSMYVRPRAPAAAAWARRS